MAQNGLLVCPIGQGRATEHEDRAAGEHVSADPVDRLDSQLLVSATGTKDRHHCLGRSHG